MMVTTRVMTSEGSHFSCEKNVVGRYQVVFTIHPSSSSTTTAQQVDEQEDPSSAHIHSNK